MCRGEFERGSEVGLSHVKAENALAGLQRENPKYAEPAYLFVLSALHRRLARLEVPRHISGAEVADAVRELALDRYGPLARTVLEHWGVHTTSDMGEIVFALVGCGILVKQARDTREDFEGLFSFEEAFEDSYPWSS